MVNAGFSKFVAGYQFKKRVSRHVTTAAGRKCQPNGRLWIGTNLPGDPDEKHGFSDVAGDERC